MHLRQRIQDAACSSPTLVYIPRASRPVTYKEIASEFEKVTTDSRFLRNGGTTTDTAMGIAYDCVRGRRPEDPMLAHHRLEAAYADWVRIVLRQAWIKAFVSHHMRQQAIKRCDACPVQAVEHNIRTLERTVGVLLTDFDQDLINASRAYAHSPHDIQSHRATLSTLLSTERQLWEHTRWEFLHRHSGEANHRRHSNNARQNGHRSPIRDAHSTHTTCPQNRSRALAGRSMQIEHTSSAAQTLNRRPVTVAITSMVSPVGKSMKTRPMGAFLDTVPEEEETTTGRMQQRATMKAMYTAMMASTTDANAIATHS